MHMYMYVCVHGPIPQPRADAKVRRRCFIATLAHAVIITTTISSSPHPPPLLASRQHLPFVWESGKQPIFSNFEMLFVGLGPKNEFDSRHIHSVALMM